ncbi:hypothetical protein K1719_003262 [Acacia pycnantha]|nr:hypothetical protein K1719_003262 [Acacia pycnantha]
MDGTIPTVDFATHILNALNKRMGLAVTVKLLERKIGIRPLCVHLQNIWKPTGKTQVIDLDNDCFLVKFKDEMDFQNALINGLRVIYGHYLTVQLWHPAFKPQEHADNNTHSGDRGKFARIAVLVDLTMPLTSTIMVDDELIYFEYEGLPTICFHCGQYGHRQESCPAKMATIMDSGNEQLEMQTEREQSQEACEQAQYGSWMYDEAPNGAMVCEDDSHVVYDHVRHTPTGEIVATTQRKLAGNGPKICTQGVSQTHSPLHKFSFEKIWLLAAQFEILGNSIGIAPKDKIFNKYIVTDGFEEYIDYIFPEEAYTTNLKLLEAAYQWKKKQKLSSGDVGTGIVTG